MRFFNRKADVIQPNSEHNAFARVLNIHQVFRMITVCFGISGFFHFSE